MAKQRLTPLLFFENPTVPRSPTTLHAHANMNRFRRLGPFALAGGVFLAAGACVGGAFWALSGLGYLGDESPGEARWVAYLLGAGVVPTALVLLGFVTGRLFRNEPKNHFAENDRGTAGPTTPDTTPPTGSQGVLVYINGGWQPALFVERTAAGAYVVYVPHAPDARSGAVYVVESFQVTPLNIPTREMWEIIRRSGKGLSGHAGELFATG